MANPISDFMSNWLNKTYEYLKETGGPTYPAPTVGPNVLPTGPYSMLEDYPMIYGDVPLPFNPGATGIPATASSQVEAAEEVAKQNPPPTTFSENFGMLFGGNMKACIEDQRHRAGNPNALNACRNLAETGDTSGMSLQQIQKDRLGIKALLSNENDKPDDVRLTENENSLTGQIAEGASNFVKGVNSLLPGGGTVGGGTVGGGGTIGGGGEPAEKDKGFSLIDYMKDWKTLVPGAPEIEWDGIIMVGGAALLVLLLIVIIK